MKDLRTRNQHWQTQKWRHKAESLMAQNPSTSLVAQKHSLHACSRDIKRKSRLIRRSSCKTHIIMGQQWLTKAKDFSRMRMHRQQTKQRILQRVEEILRHQNKTTVCSESTSVRTACTNTGNTKTRQLMTVAKRSLLQKNRVTATKRNWPTVKGHQMKQRWRQANSNYSHSIRVQQNEKP